MEENPGVSLSHQTGICDAVTDAGLLLKYGGVDAVKLKGPARAERYMTPSNFGFGRECFLELEGLGTLRKQTMCKAG